VVRTRNVSAGTTEPRVSVLTPFYNSDASLVECIESVLAQTYGNFEYLLVNNCSTDRSLEIAESYRQRDPRIRVLQNPVFLTQIQNYNQALGNTSPDSRYIKIVQADDAIFPHCLSDMVALAEAHPTVGVVSSYRMNGSSVEPPRVMPHTKTVMSGREAGALYITEGLYLLGTQTTVLMRADLVRRRQPFYPEGRVYADSDALYDILLDCDFGFVHQILSFTRVDEESIYGRNLDYRPDLLCQLITLKTYGSRYLTPDELARHGEAFERRYRRFLAEAWLARREPAFWELHREGLRTVGEDIDQARLLRDVAATVLHYAVRPHTVVGKLLRHVRGRAPGPQG